MKRGKDEPGLWEPDGAPEIDRALEESDDPLGRVLLRTSPAILPDEGAAPPDEAPALFSDPEPEPTASPAPAPRTAPAGARLRAFAADAVVCAIVAMASLLSAAAVDRRSPSPRAWLWCAAFALVVSFFLVVPTLALFGRTPGMALADLSAGEEEKPSFGASLRRWLGTAATVLLAGVPLVTALFDRERRTPADIWSGRPLRADREPVA